jgi:nucleoid DNA-binding protein
VELAIYIKNLLYNHDKVIVSGFGALKTVYKPAEINSSQHTIHPPSKTLEFDGSKVPSDGLLEKYIASQQGITQKNAEELISNQIQAETQKLDSGETLFWEGIGYFSKENDAIRFEPEPEANFLTDSFGLSKIDYKPAEFKFSPKHTISKEITSKKKIHTYLIIFPLVILVLGGGIATYFYYPDILSTFKRITQKPSVTKPSKNAQTLTTTTKDTSKESELEQFMDKTTDKKKALSINPTPDTLAVQENVSYYVIAGSFKTYERATILANQLKKEGYKPEVIQFDEELFRVSLGEFKNKSQALIELDKIKESKGEDAVWLLTKKI